MIKISDQLSQKEVAGPLVHFIFLTLFFQFKISNSPTYGYDCTCDLYL